MRTWTILPVVLTLMPAVAATAGCAGTTFFDDSGGPPGDAGVGEPGPQFDVTVLDDRGNRDLPTIYACDTVDILFVIDNSNTMQQEQESLVKSFPKFIQAIEAIQPPIKSYHIGVVSTDVGAGPKTIQGASYKCVPDGDAGKLQHTAKGGASCKTSYPKFLKGPSATVTQDFGCVARLGLGGCGFEQQMESALRALSNQPYNQGFLRKNAPLAIIFITDEDDCSAQDKSIFDLDNQSYGHVPTRCVRLTGKLHPVKRYIDGFKKLKDNPERIVVAAITGPPGPVQYDNTVSTGMLPSCTSAGLGEAYPGNRFETLVKAFGDRGVQESLCQGDLAAPLQLIGKAINRVCLK